MAPAPLAALDAARVQHLEVSTPHTTPHSRVPKRYVVALLSAAVAAICYGERAGINIAVVKMQATLGWSRHVQGQILAAFYLGYMVAQLPGGWVAARFGPRRSLLASLLASSVVNLLLPVAALASPWLVCGLRVIQGLAQGVLFPGIAALWTYWAPPTERSRLDSIPRAGGFAGGSLCNVLAGMQIDSRGVPIVGGWEGVFYLWGLVGIAFSAVWWYSVTDSPESDPHCSRAEATFIRRTTQQYMATRGAPLAHSGGGEDASAAAAAGMGSADPDDPDDASGARKLCSSPPEAPPVSACSLYGHIIRSRACWALAIAHATYDVGLYILDDGLPPFLRDALDMRFTDIGWVLAAPGVLKPLVIVAAAATADRLRRSMRTLHVRKLITVVAFLPQVAILFLLGTGVLNEPFSITMLMVLVLPFGLAANGGGCTRGPPTTCTCTCTCT